MAPACLCGAFTRIRCNGATGGLLAEHRRPGGVPSGSPSASTRNEHARTDRLDLPIRTTTDHRRISDSGPG
ncbi:predicted protein [Streptomyces viridochromogenes DSM 40736]|uniref:Predicted protein n=1 Tax=Streptomyces viridochromogenes (strain DSM 40736 / JCM 4977 / BCRC 1201 / Tue 494) TaxID=591159 RepID=D9XGC7_STRVT|nr:predicted protein [Streptomyces viridochromogenes DSM 40736]